MCYSSLLLSPIVIFPSLRAGSSDGAIKVWDCEKHYCTHNLQGSKGMVTLLRFHPSSKSLTLFSSSVDCAIRVWDLHSSR